MSTRVLPMNNCPRRRVQVLCVLLLALPSAGAQADVDIDKLWLPVSHQRHLPRLYDAARLLKAYSGCASFLEGTTQLDRSRPDHPVFSLRCRGPEGETFTVLVDGPSLEKLDDTRPAGRVSFEQLQREYEREQARLQEQRERQDDLAALELTSNEAQRLRERWRDWWGREYQRREHLWAQCEQLLEQRVGRMAELEWLTDSMPEADMAEPPTLETHPPLTFVMDFNAQSYHGEALRYRAYCRTADEQAQSSGETEAQMELEVRPRRED